MTSKSAWHQAPSANSLLRPTLRDGFQSTSTNKEQASAVMHMRTCRWPLLRSIRGSQRLLALGVAFVGLCVPAVPSGAHGFGQRYDLPLPLSLYLLGTATAVILSFVVVGLFARHTPGARGYPRLDLQAHPLGRWLAHPVLLASLKLITASVFILTVTAGFFGNQDPYRNI